MPGGRTLSRAERLLRARKYREVISLLEPQVFHNRNNPAFYRLLGTACLYTGEFGGAHTYLTRAAQIRPGVTAIELPLAVVELRRRDVPEAIRLILSVLDREPQNRRARRLLALVRRTEDPTEFAPITESRAVRRYLPPLGMHIPRWVPIGLAAAALVTAGFFLLPPLLPRVTQLLGGGARGEREGFDPLTVDLPADLTANEGEFRYILTAAEIEALVDRIGELFNRFRDNLARREANRLLLSNASPIIKERVRLVASYFREPSFVDFSDNFSFREVAQEPWLYDGCYVRWNGQTSNIASGEEGTRFTLLVGYTDERTLEGTVPVLVPFTAEVEPGSVELIGRVVYERRADARAAGRDISLVATSIRPIVPRRE